MTDYLISHNNQPLQTQNFVHDGFNLTLITRWNVTFKFWNIDLFDNLKQEWLTQSEALSIGSAAISHLDTPFVIVMIGDEERQEVTREALGDTLNIYLVPRESYLDAVRQRV